MHDSSLLDAHTERNAAHVFGCYSCGIRAHAVGIRSQSTKSSLAGAFLLFGHFILVLQLAIACSRLQLDEVRKVLALPKAEWAKHDALDSYALCRENAMANAAVINYGVDTRYPADVACRHSYTPLAHAIRRTGCFLDSNPESLAIKQQHQLQIVRLLIEHGARVNKAPPVLDEHGREEDLRPPNAKWEPLQIHHEIPPLMLAVHAGSLPLVELLIEHAADVSVASELEFAMYTGRYLHGLWGDHEWQYLQTHAEYLLLPHCEKSLACLDRVYRELKVRLCVCFVHALVTCRCSQLSCCARVCWSPQ